MIFGKNNDFQHSEFKCPKDVNITTDFRISDEEENSRTIWLGGENIGEEGFSKLKSNMEILC